MVESQYDSELRQTQLRIQHRIHRAEIACVIAFVILTALTIMAGFSGFVR